MPTQLSLDEHISAIASCAKSLRDTAGRAGLDAPVPTCPEWHVADLIVHVGMVHRWAAANLQGDKDHDTADSTAEAAAAPDLLEWFSDGAAHLVATIEAAPDDAPVLVFLKDAPPPRRFLARRQAHETAIHGVDALAAMLGRWPVSAELTVPPDLATDGIDELLCGFVPRRSGRLRSAEPFTLHVTASDTGHAWTLEVSGEPVVATPGAHGTPDATLSGTAVQLYAGLWNRGDEVAVDGRADILTIWRDQVRVRWS